MDEVIAATDWVTAQMVKGVAVVRLDRPPVNALSHKLRAQLAQVIAAVGASDAVGMVITGPKGTFVAGSDISELGQFPSPTLPEVIARIVDLAIPTIAAIDGVALGGGLELALGCQMRIATATSRLGFPEITLGLLPGAGGTVRTTHLCGALATLDLVTSGKPVGAQRALDLGLIDRVVEDGVVEAAIEMVQSAQRQPISDTLCPFDEAAFEAAARVLRAKGKPARWCVEAVRIAATKPLDVALTHERALFVEACASPEARALRHLYLAEHQAARVEGLDLGLARPLHRIGVIGAGTMGRGIAMACADAGLSVRLREVNGAALAAGLEAIVAQYQAAVDRSRLTPAEADVRVERITGTLAVSDLADCDLVIEAAFEDMEVKRALFAELDAALGPEMILATNTSYLDVNAIANVVRRPERVLGLHFFSPANIMKLLEIVRAERTDQATLATGLALSKRMKKISVVVGVCRGFVGNRMLQARNSQLSTLLLEGARPAQVDAAFREFGWPMGPFEMQDMAGLDISWRMRKGLGLRDEVPDALCEAGRLGQKAGRGWYRYDMGSRRPVADPEVDQIITRIAAERRVSPREIAAPEILDRTHGPMVAEGRKIVAEGIAARASDIDVVWVNGYGFPRHLGGPMYWADQSVI
jgi:3-hydroxyacyl-CoA dehydrogenase